MTIRYWLGDDSVNLGDVGEVDNWYPAPASIAAMSGDTLIFDGRTTQAVDTDCDAIADADIEVGNLFIENTFTGQIGTATAPFALNSTGFSRIEGAGDCYLMAAKQSAAAHANSTFGHLVINVPRNTTVKLFSQANDSGNLNKFSIVQIISGTVVFVGSDDENTVTPTPDAGCFAEKILLTPKSASNSDILVNIGVDCDDKDNTESPILYATYGTVISATEFSELQNIFGASIKMVV